MVVLGAIIFFMSVLKGVPFAWVGRDNRNPVIQGSTKWSATRVCVVYGFGFRGPGNTYLWLVGNGRMVVIVVIIVPHSSIPY